MATKKKTSSKSKKTETESKTVRDRVIGLQLRSLELQENAFHRTFDAVASVQERSEDRVHAWLEKSDRVPTEARKMVGEWIAFNQKARDGYKSAVAKSFDLGQEWVQGMQKSA